MDEHQLLAEQFEAHRPHLRAAAYRMLGSSTEADDAVQESWLRVSRAGTAGVENLGGWLTTIVARVCLNRLSARKSRPEEPLGAEDVGAAGPDPEHEVVLADSVGLALLVVLETLTPAERLAFVLHDMFELPFDEIAPIVDRSPAAARQLASRARRRVRGASVGENDPVRRRQVVDAFLAASRDGDFEALLNVLDPNVVLRADPAAVAAGSASEVRGGRAVAEVFSGRARAAQPALVNGAVGLVWAPGGRPRVVWGFAIEAGRVVAIDMVADADRLSELDLIILDDAPAE